jgi:hypothetical protein
MVSILLTYEATVSRTTSTTTTIGIFAPLEDEIGGKMIFRKFHQKTFLIYIFLKQSDGENSALSYTYLQKEMK